MFKRTLAFILLGIVLAGAGAAYTGGLPSGDKHLSDRHHGGDDD